MQLFNIVSFQHVELMLFMSPVMGHQQQQSVLDQIELTSEF
jgi:hypothetical protein